jgi:hypothetical protein
MQHQTKFCKRFYSIKPDLENELKISKLINPIQTQLLSIQFISEPHLKSITHYEKTRTPMIHVIEFIRICKCTELKIYQ